MILGGVEIPYELGLLGHSDADVLAHAIMDALLGAVAAGDIGKLFPDTDAAWKDADSLVLLGKVKDYLAGEGWAIGHVDATVIAECPRLAPHIDAMRGRLADAMGIEKGLVSVKATTVETMGALGRREGMAAMAAVTVTQ